MHHEADKDWIEKGVKTNTIYLSQKDFDFIVDMINNPTEPNEALKKLFRDYKKN